MGTTANQIVQVTITRETRPVAVANFGIILVVGPNSTTTNRLDYYTELSDIAANVTGGTGSAEYKAAEAILSQNPRVALVAIGKKEAGDADYGVALDAIKNYQSNFYGVIGATRTQTDQEDIVTWVNSNKRIAAFASAGTDVGGGVIDIKDQPDGTDTSSLAYFIKNGAYDRSECIYQETPADNWVDAAHLGKILPLTPGSYTGAFWTLTGIPKSILTPTQVVNLHAKYCSTYEEVGRVNILFQGWVGTGEYIDIIIFQDWLEAKIVELVYSALVNAPKVAYTDGGITVVQNALEQALKLGQDNGGISPTAYDPTTKEQIGGYVTSVPSRASVPANDVATRTLNNVKFTAWLAGAIHIVKINGNLTF